MHGFKLHPPKVIFNFVQIKTKNAPENQSMIFQGAFLFCGVVPKSQLRRQSTIAFRPKGKPFRRCISQSDFRHALAP